MRAHGLVVAVLAIALVVIGGGPARAQEELQLDAQIAGVDIRSSSSDSPVTLDPDAPTDLVVTVRNAADETLEIEAVRLSGEILGVTFFSYDITVDMDIDPGDIQTRALPLELSGLRDQAVGLLPAAVGVLDSERDEIARAVFVADVRGSLRSTLGWFALAVIVLTVMTLVSGLLALRRHTLPRNRFSRATQFAIPGAGLGLTIVVGLAVLRIFAPSPATAVPVATGAMLLGFGLGALTKRHDFATESDAATAPLPTLPPPPPPPPTQDGL